MHKLLVVTLIPDMLNSFIDASAAFFLLHHILILVRLLLDFRVNRQRVRRLLILLSIFLLLLHLVAKIQVVTHAHALVRVRVVRGVLGKRGGLGLWLM